jgi:hypothetical protein
MLANQPTLVEQSVDSTRKLAWYDEMIRKYYNVKAATYDIIQLMDEQVRRDERAFELLSSVYALSLSKIENLEAARAKHYAKHEHLMNRVLEGEE